MLRRVAWLLALIACAGGLPQKAFADPPPNILLVIADDAGFPFHGFMGHPDVQTPVLDSLASQGTVFPVSHVVSSLCRPSLPGILTGLYPKDTPSEPGAPTQLATSVPTIASLLGSAGYVSLHTGKTWPGGIGEFEQAYGFTETDGLDPHSIGRDTMQPIYDFVDAHAGTPWFIWYAPYIPHTPHNPPQEFLDLYALVAKKHRSYYASITQLDDTVGQILDHLQTSGEADNTIVFYISDNGYHLKKSKGKWTENGYRTPILIHDPRSATPGGMRSEMANAVDLLPTILDYAGVAMPGGAYEGASLRPMAENQTVPGWRTYLFGQYSKQFGYPSIGRHVRSHDGFKFYKKCGRKGQLYDLNVDPDERDRLKLDDYPAKVAEFEAALDAWWNPCPS